MANGSDGSIIIDTELDSSGFQRDSKSLQKQADNLVASINKIGKIPFDSARFSTQVDKARDSIEQLQGKLEEMGSKTISTADYESVTKSIEKAEKALFKLYDRRDLLSDLGVKENSTQWRRLEMQILNAEEELERFAAQKAALEASGQATIMGTDTTEYAQISAALQEATERLQEFERAKANAGKTSWIGTALSGLKNALMGVASAALHAAKSVAKMGFRALTNGIKSAISALKSFKSHSNNATLTANGLLKALTSVKTMLISRVKRMFISYIFNEMKEAMTALQTFDKSFGTAMNNMKNSAKMLSANLAVSFGNLITAIEPVLTKIITAISTVISYLNALFAMLGGKSTMTVAKKQMNDYAAAAGGASGKMEELKRQVYSFDELNKRSKDSDSGGGGGTSAADLFEEVPISSYLPDSVKDFFERIKAAFEAGDWEEIGRIVAEGLNSGMKLVDDWINGTLQPLAFTWSERVARMLNGLVEGIDWALMGKTLADGINTVFGTINIFLTTFDFAALGVGIGNGINSAVANVDWATIGVTFANKWNMFIHGIYGLVTTVDWAAIGNSLATGVTSWVNTIDWATAGKALSTGIIGLATSIYTGLEKVDWQQVGKKVAIFVGNIDWAGVVSALSRGIGAALGAIGGFIWGAIEDSWNEVVQWWEDTAYEDGQFTMEGLLQGIKDKLSGIWTWIKTNIFDPFIKGFKNAFGIASPSKVMQEQGQYVIEGLLNGISQTWGKITSFFSTSISALKTTLSNGWNNMKTNASTAWTNIKTSITTQFNTAKATLTTGVSPLKTTVSNGWNNIKSATTLSWSNISSTVTTKWNGLKTTLQNTNWSSVGSNICSGIRSGINSGWSWLTSTVSSLASSLLSTAKRVLGIRSPSRVFRDEVGQFVGLGLAEGIEDTEQTVAKTVANLAESTVDAFGDPTLAVDTAGADMVSGLDAVASRLSTIASTFQSITAMLNSLGGLNIPQIAVGTVAPPRTRVDTNAVGNSGSNALDSFIKEMVEYMIENGQTLQEILDVLRRLRLTVDADSLSNAVTNARNTQIRNFGGA